MKINYRPKWNFLLIFHFLVYIVWYRRLVLLIFVTIFVLFFHLLSFLVDQKTKTTKTYRFNRLIVVDRLDENRHFHFSFVWLCVCLSLPWFLLSMTLNENYFSCYNLILIKSRKLFFGSDEQINFLELMNSKWNVQFQRAFNVCSLTKSFSMKNRFDTWIWLKYHRPKANWDWILRQIFNRFSILIHLGIYLDWVAMVTLLILINWHFNQARRAKERTIKAKMKITFENVFIEIFN